MPHEILAEVAGQIVQEVAVEAGDRVHRRFGWKGCTAIVAVIAATIAALIYLV
jgi:hypothetical protein